MTGPSIEQVIADLQAVKPHRWKYHGYPTENDALVKVPFGHLRDLLAFAQHPAAGGEATADPWWDVQPGVNYLAEAHGLKDRALVAAEYRLSASPHEWTDEDSKAMALFIPAALGAIEQQRRESIALMKLLAKARAAQPAPASVERLREISRLRAVQIVEAQARGWFCSGDDCTEYDSGRDEGFRLAIVALKVLDPFGPEILAALSSPAAASAVGQEGETAWLIEWPANRQMPLRYWHPAEGHVIDPSHTVRFSRKEDAEAMRIYLHLQGARSVEHKWLAALSTPTLAGGGPVLSERELANVQRLAARMGAEFMPHEKAPLADEGAVERVRAYIRAYEDAPSWGGPTMYPAPPSIADLKALLAR